MAVPQQDLDILNALPFDEQATPNFEYLKYCLIWDDETPQARLSEEGRDLLTDMWVVRGYIHRAVPEDQWDFDPAYFRKTWDFAQAHVPNWPGFKRVNLSQADKDYLDTYLAQDFSDL